MSEPRLLKDMMGAEMGMVWEKASPARKEAFKAASGMRRVFAVWNEVMERERGRDHVTGLYFVAEARRLIAYVDSPAWCQELFMMREVLRTRMSLKGVELSEISFKVSKDGYRRDPRLAARSATAGLSDGGRAAALPPAPLTDEERSRIRSATSAVGDDNLRRALEKAMAASFEWKKGQRGV